MVTGVRPRVVLFLFDQIEGQLVSYLRLLDDESSHGRRDANMHIALTRALLVVRVVAPGDEVRNDPNLKEWV